MVNVAIVSSPVAKTSTFVFPKRLACLMGGNTGNSRGGKGYAPKPRHVISTPEADEFQPVTMAHVNGLVAKNDKPMQLLVESYRRSGTTTPLWLSSIPYYKKDTMLVVNFRDDKIPLLFSNEPDVDRGVQSRKQPEVVSAKTKSGSISPIVPKERVFPTPQPCGTSGPPKSFAVSGGEAASRLGLRIGAAADSVGLKREAHPKAEPPAKESVKQPEMAIVGNVRNLVGVSGSGWDGLENILGGAVSVDPLTITSDPLWGADTGSAATSDNELQNMLSVLQDLRPVEFPSAVDSDLNRVRVPSGSDSVEYSVPHQAPISHFQAMPSAQNLPVPGSHGVHQNSQPSGQYSCYYMPPQGAAGPMAGLPANQMQYIQLQQIQYAQAAAAQAAIAQQQHQMFFPSGQMMSHGMKQGGAHMYGSPNAVLLQQQQQLMSQQQAALAAQQLLSKGPGSGGAPMGNSAAKASSPVQKSPNPNAIPFQPPPQDRRFNVEATPFVPPGGSK